MKRSALRTSSALRLGLALCALLLFASCNASEEAVYADADSPLGSASDSSRSGSSASPDSSGIDRADIRGGDVVTGPSPSSTPREVGLTVGERLKRLDMLMQTAPPDSLGLLMAEYERLLDSAMGGPAASEPTAAQSAPTSGPAGEQTASAAPSYPRSTPRSSIANGGDNRTLVQSDVRAGKDSSFDPSRFGGVRQSELEYYRENVPAQQQTPTTAAPRNAGTASASPSGESRSTAAEKPAASSTTSSSAASTAGGSDSRAASGSRVQSSQASKAKGKGKKKKKEKRSRSASNPSTVAAAPSSSTSTESKPNRSASLSENYTEGLAHFRAGRYRQAIENLKPVANSPGSSYRTIARYYYALSLERTGSLAQAAGQFRSLSKGSGTIADKGWLGYCRVLSAQGKKGEAKKELLRLIKQRPGSSQIAGAKQMLQQL